MRLLPLPAWRVGTKANVVRNRSVAGLVVAISAQMRRPGDNSVVSKHKTSIFSAPEGWLSVRAIRHDEGLVD